MNKYVCIMHTYDAEDTMKAIGRSNRIELDFSYLYLGEE